MPSTPSGFQPEPCGWGLRGAGATGRVHVFPAARLENQSWRGGQPGPREMGGPWAHPLYWPPRAARRHLHRASMCPRPHSPTLGTITPHMLTVPLLDSFPSLQAAATHPQGITHLPLLAAPQPRHLLICRLGCSSRPLASRTALMILPHGEPCRTDEVAPPAHDTPVTRCPDEVTSSLGFQGSGDLVPAHRPPPPPPVHLCSSQTS